ncbi:MAG: AAA family ATPase, partial [Candidatus Saccharibacteria bacterium]|nr:AAA family ATPase [Microbacteriaceae bacterium]
MTETDLATPSLDAPSGSPALREQFAQVRTEVGKAVVGQDGAVTGLMIALLA